MQKLATEFLNLPFWGLPKPGFDGLFKAGQILNQGLEDISKEVLRASRSSFDRASTTLHAASEARSPQAFVTLQVEYAKDTLNQALEHGAALGSLGAKIADALFAPIREKGLTAAPAPAAE